MQHLLIATHNVHKTAEFETMLGADFDVGDLTQFPGFRAAEETGGTFEENAVLKAREAGRHFGGLVLADDSGLEVDALAGAPGIFSARFAGPDAGDAGNWRKLLEELTRVGARGKARSARFRCVLALARGDEILHICDGRVEGVIINEPKGAGGFGYDPLFVSDGFCETFAQMSAAEKNRLSHRGRAIRKMVDWIKNCSRRDGMASGAGNSE